MGWNDYFTTGSIIKMPSMLTSTAHIGALIECMEILKMLSEKDEHSEYDLDLMRYWNKKALSIINDISNGLAIDEHSAIVGA